MEPVVRYTCPECGSVVRTIPTWPHKVCTCIVDPEAETESATDPVPDAGAPVEPNVNPDPNTP